MATVVKVGDAVATALGFRERVDSAICQSQCSSISLRSPRSFGSAVLRSGCSACHRNSLLKVSKPDSFRAMALPLYRRSIQEGKGPAAQEEDSQATVEEPWLGAVVFRRSAHKTHYEFNTSLERLGLGKLSTAGSRALATSMGLNSARSVPAEEEGTPVSIAIDVSRDEDTKDLRLGGIARTTISLCCNRCLSPMVERIFASFNLLLTQDPVLEPTQQRLGVVLGDNGAGDDGSELDLDLDDKLHFPRESKEIDLSKYLRDSVHLEIPYKSLCSIQCAGLCLTCGVNLNERTCDCQVVDVKPTWGPLQQLRKQMKDDEELQ